MVRKTGESSVDASGPERTGAADRGAWYPDPYGDTDERWYDGTGWTDQTRGDPKIEKSEPVTQDSQQIAVATVSQPAAPPEAPTATWAPPDGAAAPADERQTPPPEPVERLEAPAVTGAASGPLFGPPVETRPARVCPHCAALSHNDGLYCAHCGGPFAGAQARAGVSTRVKVVAWLVAALLVLGGAAAGVAIKLHHDSQVAAQHRRAAAAAAARQQAQQQAQQTEQTQRQSLESALESSITSDATQRANSGLLFNGPALNTTCTPVSGGSSQNLSESTGTYSCLAVYQNNPDGTSNGYGFTGTINFDTGTFTWHLGNGTS